MALQIPNAPQLESDPYARSRSAFNDILSVFKEQRALKQNAKMMADKFENDMRMEMYKGQIELGIREEIGKQTFAQDVAKLQMTAGIQNINSMYEQMNKKTESYKKQFDSLDNVINNFAPEYIQKPRFKSYVDPETGTPVIKAFVVSGDKEVEIEENDIETYYNEMVRLKPVADFIERWQKGDNISEETTPNRIGRGMSGQEFIQRLKSGDSDAIQDVLKERVTHNLKDTATTKEIDARIKAYTDIQQGINAAMQGGGQIDLGNWSLDKESRKFVAKQWGSKATEIDFAQNDVIEVIDRMRAVENRWFKLDSVDDTEINAIKQLAGRFELMLNEYVRSKTTEGAMPPTIKEFFGSGKYYFNPNNNFAIEERSGAAKTTLQMPSSQLYQYFK